MLMRVKALRSVVMLAGVFEAGQEYDVSEADQDGAALLVDVGHLELLALEDSKPADPTDAPKKGGRPKGSKNKPKDSEPPPPAEPEVNTDGNVSNSGESESPVSGV